MHYLGSTGDLQKRLTTVMRVIVFHKYFPAAELGIPYPNDADPFYDLFNQSLFHLFVCYNTFFFIIMTAEAITRSRALILSPG